MGRRPYRCFAPEDQAAGDHQNFTSKPFGEEELIWIGYRDHPSRSYGNHCSLDEVMAKARTNYNEKRSKAFPRYNTRFKYVEHLEEDVDFTADCLACRRSGQCSQVDMEYLTIAIDSEGPGKTTNIFLCACKFELQDETMLALVFHTSKGCYWFQHEDGELSKKMAVRDVRIANDLNGSNQPLLAEESNDMLAANTIVMDEQQTQPTFSPTLSGSTSSDQAVASDLMYEYLSDSDDEPLIQQRRRHTVDNMATGKRAKRPTTVGNPCQTQLIPSLTKPMPAQARPIASQTRPTQNQARPSVSATTSHTLNDLEREYGAMLSTIVLKYGMASMNIPEAQDADVKMVEVVKANDRHALCQLYGALNALLLSHQLGK